MELLHKKEHKLLFMELGQKGMVKNGVYHLKECIIAIGSICLILVFFLERDLPLTKLTQQKTNHHTSIFLR